MDTPEPPPSAIPLAIRLPEKPSAKLICRFFKRTDSKAPTNVLVVFLNGLRVSQSGWWDTITHYLDSQHDHPALLTYDRYGQGLTTDTDPLDDGLNPNPPGQRHDIASVVTDLHALIGVITSTPVDTLKVIFVANSIGCTIARAYAEHYHTVAGMLMLDAYMTDTDFISLYPDPDAKDFNADTLPEDVTVDDLRNARSGMGKLFHPSVTNTEGLWRGNIQTLLPQADFPPLAYDGQKGPYITVVGHDPEVFADESTRMAGMTRTVAMQYTNPAWHIFHEKLLCLTSLERRRLIVAEGAGHFVQADRPDLVADELAYIYKAVCGAEWLYQCRISTGNCIE
ncbi:hypothetical protein ABW21_db0209557 [Orbilia brochopaga]|nr:hypothetical protein ABW21_db0209557 [Drechslerella brochopaga]